MAFGRTFERLTFSVSERAVESTIGRRRAGRPFDES